jgi:hypothetical protein
VAREPVAPRTTSRPAFAAPARPEPARPAATLDIAPEHEAAPERHALCARHPGTKAYETCARCGDFVCPACRQWSRGGVQCPDCASPEASGPEVPLTALSVVEYAARAGVGAGWKGLVMASIPTITQAAFGAALTAVLLTMPSIPVLVATVALGAVLSVWISMRAQAGVFALARAALSRSELPSFGEAFAYGSGRCLGLFGTQLLAGLALALMMFLPFSLSFWRSPVLIVAGTILALAVDAILALRWSVLIPVVLEEGVTGSKALGRSSELVSGRTGTVVLTFILVAVLAIVVGALTYGVSLMAPFPIPAAVNVVVGTLNFVFTTSLVTTLYFGLAGEKRR